MLLFDSSIPPLLLQEKSERVSFPPGGEKERHLFSPFSPSPLQEQINRSLPSSPSFSGAKIHPPPPPPLLEPKFTTRTVVINRTRKIPFAKETALLQPRSEEINSFLRSSERNPLCRRGLGAERGKTHPQNSVLGWPTGEGFFFSLSGWMAPAQEKPNRS